MMEPLLDYSGKFETQPEDLESNLYKDALRDCVRFTQCIKKLEEAALAREIAEIRLMKALRTPERDY